MSRSASSQGWGGFALLALVTACHGHDQVQGTGAASATPSVSVAAPAPSAPAPLASRAPASPASPAVVEQVTLTTGAKLTLPANTAEKASPKALDSLPDEAKKARVFLLDRNPKRLLMVTEMDRKGKSCDGALDEQRSKIAEARKDDDPMRTGMRKVSSFEEMKVAGHRLLYTEAKQRKLVAPGRDPLPFVGIASATLCRDDTFVVLMYASDQPELPGGTKKMLVEIASSWQKPT